MPGRVTEVDPEDGRILQIDRSLSAPRNTYIPEVNAGCETLLCLNDDPDFVKTQVPEVIKDPRLAWCGHELIDAGVLDIRHLIVCVRRLSDVASSKKEGMSKAESSKWYSHSYDKIYDISAWQLGVCVAEMTVRNVPMTFLEFPKFTQDLHYFQKQMLRVFPKVPPIRFAEAWRQTIKPELVHYK